MLSKANVRGLVAGLGLAAGLVVVGSSCHQAIPVAPEGSSIAVIANPTTIPAYGGVSVITAILHDGTGQPVADGTVVQFFTDLGRIDEQGRTNDGVVRVNLVADGRSGIANVTASSGGGVVAPSSSPSGSPGATPSSTASRIGEGRLFGTSGTASLASTTGGVSQTISVKIGSSAPATVVISADPRNIASDAPRYTTLTATVFDGSGNPIANVPVVFRITEGSDPDFSEFVESGGRPTFTDNNGQAHDRLWTTRERDATAQTVKVEAVVVTSTELVSKTPVQIGINY